MGPIAAAVVPAAISGATTLAGAAIGGKGNKRAAESQERSNSEAIALARENEARRRQEYDQAQALQRQQWDAEQARLEPYRNARLALLAGQSRRLGLNIGSLGGARPSGPPPGAGRPAGVSRGSSIGALGGYSGPVEALEAPRLSIQDLAGWGARRMN